MSQLPSRSQNFRAGATSFAAVLMLLVGGFQFIQGLLAAFNSGAILVTTPNYVFRLDASTWGWVHMIVGVGMIAAGAFILMGNTAARVAGIALAALQALIHFVWLPQMPVWSILIIAMDVIVIWSLSTVRLDSL